MPWSLATWDGSLAKTYKSALAKLLEDGVEILPNLPNPSAVIIHAMALMQTLPRIPDCFTDLADLILSAVIKQVGEARRIDCSRPVRMCLNKHWVWESGEIRPVNCPDFKSTTVEKVACQWFEQDQHHGIPCRCVGDWPALWQEDQKKNATCHSWGKFHQDKCWCSR